MQSVGEEVRREMSGGRNGKEGENGFVVMKFKTETLELREKLAIDGSSKPGVNGRSRTSSAYAQRCVESELGLIRNIINLYINTYRLV